MPDGVGNSCWPGEDIVVPDAEETEAAPAQLRIAHHVAGIFSVLAAVGLDDQFGGVADKIGNIGSDGDLAAELVVNEASISQKQPKSVFRLGRLVAHGSRELL